jgi:hypothetical protein
MNLDEVADQHAWITVDSKSQVSPVYLFTKYYLFVHVPISYLDAYKGWQVWIANSSEGKELKVNTRPIPPGGKPMMLHHNSIMFIEGRAFRFEEGKIFSKIEQYFLETAHLELFFCRLLVTNNSSFVNLMIFLGRTLTSFQSFSVAYTTVRLICFSLRVVLARQGRFGRRVSFRKYCCG